MATPKTKNDADFISVKDIVKALPTIDFADLKTISDAVGAQMTAKQEAAREALKMQWAKMQEDFGADAEKLGFSLNEIINAPTKPKYRHPDNHDLTWTGHGRKPRWLQGFLDAGRNVDDFLIEKPVAAAA